MGTDWAVSTRFCAVTTISSNDTVERDEVPPPCSSAKTAAGIRAIEAATAKIPACNIFFGIDNSLIL